MVQFREPEPYPFILDGGVDYISSHLEMAPGKLIAGSNVKMIGGLNGYERAGGYERCTNDTLPSETTIEFFRITSPVGDIDANALFVSGNLSVRPLETLDTPTAGDVIVVATHDTGFTNGLTFTSGANSFQLATIIGDTSGYTTEQIQTYRKTAIEQTRTNIPQITGWTTDDEIDGGFRLRGKNYVFFGGKLYRGDSYAWTEISMPDVMYFEAGIKAPSVGDTITDGTATGVIASITRQSGAWNYEEATVDQSAGYFTLTSVSGTFTATNGLTIDGDTVPAVTNGSFDTDTDWTKGTGWSITGGAAVCDGTQTADSDLSIPYALVQYDVVEFAIVVSGMTAGTLTPIIGTDAGTAISANGTANITIVATATVDTLYLRADSDFDGDIESITASVGDFATVKTANSTYSITTGGKYEIKKHNFTNLADSPNVYGVSGVGEAFEFDGTNYIPIYHPDVTTKYPNHFNIHQERLQLIFPGGEMPYSISGDPRVFNSALGAGTWSTGSEIVAARTIHANAEVVFCEDCTWLLVGDGVYDDDTATRNWQFFEHDEDIGAEEWSIAAHGKNVFLSNGELRSFGATDTTALYTSTPIAEELKPWFAIGGRSVVSSVWVKSESQYRIFFNDGQGIILTFHNNKVKGATPIRIPDGISCSWRDYEDGKEYLFFVSDTGYLYRMDSGNTHDTNYIEGSFRVPFFHYGSPGNDKMFPHLTLELDAPVLLTGDTEVTYTINHNYGSSDSPRPIPTTVDELESAGGLYGANDGYGNFVWSGPIVSEIHGYIDGYGANMSILVTFKTKYDSSFRFQTAMVEYILLGLRRK